MIQPKNEAELAEAVAAAAGPLVVRGGGTRGIGMPVEGTVLSVAGLAGVSLYEPGALTLVVKAGTPLANVEAVLAAEGQRLPFEPMDHRTLLGTTDAPAAGGTGEPTIGGVVAANVSGPRRVQAGACRDSLIGVRFVDGRGTVIKNGGRVMKNVTGYDLVKLMAGSHGTLGVLTEVAFKVLPVPESAAALTLSGLDVPRAVEALSAALGSPYEVNGAAHLTRAPEGAQTCLRIEGFAGSVAYRAGELVRLLERFGPVAVERDGARVAALWQGIRDVTGFAGQPGDVWRLSVKPADAPALVARAAPLDAILDWGGGLVWLRMPQGSDLRAALGPFAGHATLIRAEEDTKAKLGVFHPEPAPLAAIAAGLRARFDPRGLLNPGLMG